jgi:N-formylglutamate amidohydrolase
VLAASLGSLCALFVGTLASPLPRVAADDRKEAAALVAVESGTLAVLITAPHGGHEAIPDVAPRRTGKTLADEHTGELALSVAKRLEADLGRRPYLVRALFHRKYADANREESEGCESDAARPPYRAYHAAIRSAVDELRRRFPGKALLLDIHGQVHEPDAILRGTRDGKTVRVLLERAGGTAVAGPDSVFGHLAAAGYTVSPSSAPPDPREDRNFDGGFTVATYGSQNRDGIDAIQVEVGANLRKDPERREKLARDLAAALEAFLRAYGPR